ncbi:hypothetical protein [Actinoplanes sp. DH11]|uniref:hypothetical protein n=1 Tax=Actinoplanes sp. DH11 TaxID=2857011 RepID=UPI001E40EEDA|nr:hypothetical protein [Actinoplanes sp. DH11]
MRKVSDMPDTGGAAEVHGERLSGAVELDRSIAGVDPFPVRFPVVALIASAGGIDALSDHVVVGAGDHLCGALDRKLVTACRHGGGDRAGQIFGQDRTVEPGSHTAHPAELGFPTVESPAT